MKSFKEYSSQEKKTVASQVENRGSEATSAEELTKKIAAAYNGKSDTSVLKSILAEAEKSKRAGTLSNEEIETFYQSFAPMLNGFQRRHLRAIVEKLKKIEG